MLLHWQPAAWGPAASGQHPRAPHRPCTLTPTQLATPGNLQAKAKPNFALNRTPGDSRELTGEEKPRPWSAGYGTRDRRPGAARTARRARFRADTGCLCSSQVGVAETPASPSPRPALVWAWPAPPRPPHPGSWDPGRPDHRDSHLPLQGPSLTKEKLLLL